MAVRTWTIVVRCPHGVPRSVGIDWQGRLEIPDRCCEQVPERPSRLRIWWEARRLRRALRGLG